MQVELLTDKQVARALKMSRAALRLWRAQGCGPPWIRVGKRLVRYDVPGLRKWIEERMEVRNA